MRRRKDFERKLPISWHFPYVHARKSAESENPGTVIKGKQASFYDMYLTNPIYLPEAFKSNFFYQSENWRKLRKCLPYLLNHQIDWFQKMWRAVWNALRHEYRCFLLIPMSRTRDKSTKTEEGRCHGDTTHRGVFSYQLMRPWITTTSPQAYKNHAFGLWRGVKRKNELKFFKSQRLARQSRFATSQKSPGVTI